MSGMSNSDPRARLMRTPSPRSAPAHSPTIAPTTASVDADAQPAEDRWAARPGSRAWSGPGGGSRAGAAELEQPGIDRPDADHRRDRDREEHDERADDDLARAARARTTARAAARARGSGSPGRPRDRATAAARRGRCARARSRRRAPLPAADDEPERDLDERRREVRPMVPSTTALTKRPTTASGGGRMNGGKPPMMTTSCQTSRKTTKAAERPAAHRAGHEAASGHARVAPGGDADLGGRPRHATAPRRGLDRARPRQRRPAISATIRPGRGDMTTTRSATRIASGMLWVTMTIVVAAALPEPQQLEVEAFAGQRIERAERLVEQEHLGLERERPGERDALARPAGELGRAGDQRRRRRGGRARPARAAARSRRSGGQPASSSG